MTTDRLQTSNEYTANVFGDEDNHLAGLMAAAVEAGLPDIAVAADVGRLLKILTSMTPGTLALEIGTLGGYSAIWIARGLAPDGVLITLEMNPAHAEFAQEQFEQAGVAEKVDIKVGPALDTLAELDLAAGSVDVVFIDADKESYSDYFTAVKPLIAPGGLLVADNVLGSASTWIDDTNHPNIKAVDAFNRLVAADPDFETVAVPLRSGVLIARKVG